MDDISHYILSLGKKNYILKFYWGYEELMGDYRRVLGNESSEKGGEIPIDWDFQKL